MTREPGPWRALVDPRLRAVVFDLDGTLYDAAPLRRRMAVELLGHCLLHPRRAGLPRRLQRFRRERERLAEEGTEGIARRQYERPADRLGVDPDELRAEVEEWMLRRPLRHLGRFRAAGAARFFAELRERGIRIGVLSDYPAAAKLEALGLAADATVAATDPDVDRLKPDPAGLIRLLDRLGTAPDACLVIGDRDERDGECARRAGAACLLRAARPGPVRFRSFVELLGASPVTAATAGRATAEGADRG